VVGLPSFAIAYNGTESGRGRSARQARFGSAALRRSILPSSNAAAVANSYFFQPSFVGTKALTWQLTMGANAQYVYFLLPCQPGQEYTTSAYVRQTSTTTQQIQIVGGIINRNPFFGNGVSSWSASNATIASSTFAHTGTASAAVSPLGAPVGVPALVTATRQPVTASSSYTGSCWVYVPGGWGDVRVGVTWYTAAGVLLSGTTSTPTVVAAQTWTKITGTFAAPATAGYGAVFFQMTGASPATPAFLDELMLVPVGGVIAGTSTTASLTWVRLAVSFVATSPWHVLRVTSVGNALPGQVYLDAVQHEPGFVSPSPWSAYGPTIYGTFSGFVERWPSNWNRQGTYGMKQITCVDAFAPMARQNISTEYRNAVLAALPDYYWPLSEAQGSTLFADASGHAATALVPFSSGVGSATAGTATSALGDPSGTGVTITAPGAATGTVLVPAQRSLVMGGNATPWGVTVACWVAASAAGSTGVPVTIYDNNKGILLQITQTPTAITVRSLPASLAGGISVVFDLTLSPWTATLTHQLVATLALDNAGNVTINVVVDGATQGGVTQTILATYGVANPDLRMSLISVGGVSGPYPAYLTANLFAGTYAHVAVWNNTSVSTTALLQAKQGHLAYGSANALETSSSRVMRYLSYRYISPVSVESGASTMGVSQLTTTSMALDACQAVAVTENGLLIVDPRGFVTFQSRTHRYLQTTAKWVFGERTELGEIPYTGNISFDFDPTQVYNDVQVTEVGSVTQNPALATLTGSSQDPAAYTAAGSPVFFGGVPATRTASQYAYGKRGYSRTVNTRYALEAQDAADFLAAGHFDAWSRVQSLTINASANPAIFHAALAIRIGDRVTVRRRTLLGWMFSADFFIERVEPNRGPNKWEVTYQMSPAATTRQPGIFDDPVWGVFDSTLVFGY
jgi:hypothetical protein